MLPPFRSSPINRLATIAMQRVEGDDSEDTNDRWRGDTTRSVK